MGRFREIVTAPVHWVKSAVKWIGGLDPDTKFVASGGLTGGLAGILAAAAALLARRFAASVPPRRTASRG